MMQNKKTNLIAKTTSFTMSALLSLTFLVSCSAKPKTNTKPVAYTSFYAMYDLTRQIAGDKMQVENLLPPGAEPHDYEPTAKEIVSLCNSDVLVYCGSGIDEYIDDIKGSTENYDTVVINAGQGIEIKNDDPHTWLMPDNALLQLQNITDGLCEADPQNSEYYKANLSASKNKIMYLKAKCDYLKQHATKHSIVVSHGAYGYLCDYLGIEQTAVESIHGSGDPSASRMSELSKYIISNDIKYIFSSPDENSKVIDTLCEETGAQPLTLSTFEYDLNDKDYFTVFEENLQYLTQALEVSED